MKRISLGVLALALSAGAAVAGGGKIKWREGTEKEHDAAFAEAKAYGIPVMIYFGGPG